MTAFDVLRAFILPSFAAGVLTGAAILWWAFSAAPKVHR